MILVKKCYFPTIQVDEASFSDSISHFSRNNDLSNNLANNRWHLHAKKAKKIMTWQAPDKGRTGEKP